MAINKSKGASILPEISSVYTAMPNLANLEISGEASETFLARTLDGNKYSSQPQTGYITNPKIKFGVFWDSGNAVHTFMKTSMRAPTSSVNFKITDVASSPVSEIWAVTGIQLSGQKWEPNDGEKAEFELTTSGASS